MPVKRPAQSGGYHHGDLRQALIDVALAEVDRNGPAPLSLAALARTLGVSQAAPYRHFPDRDALLAAVAAEGFKAFGEALKKAVDKPAPRPPLTGICQAYAAFGMSRQGLYRLMFDSRIMADPVSGEVLSRLALDGFDRLVATLPADEPEDARRRRALRIWMALHGAVMLAAQNLLSGPSPMPLEAIIDDIAQAG